MNPCNYIPTVDESRWKYAINTSYVHDLYHIMMDGSGMLIFFCIILTLLSVIYLTGQAHFYTDTAALPSVLAQRLPFYLICDMRRIFSITLATRLLHSKPRSAILAHRPTSVCPSLLYCCSGEPHQYVTSWVAAGQADALCAASQSNTYTHFFVAFGWRMWHWAVTQFCLCYVVFLFGWKIS